MMLAASLLPSPGGSGGDGRGAGGEGSWGRDVVLLTLVLGLFFGVALGSRALWAPDEGRYVEIPREMVTTGDWLTPRLDGVKYFEKPPLFYWLEAAVIRLFGIREWALRLVPALFALAGCLAVYAAGRRLFGRRAGLLAAAVLTTSPLYYFLGNVISLDMAVSVLLTVALLAFLVAVSEPEGPLRKWLLWSFYVALALATMTKGLIGIIIPGIVIAAWIAALGDWRLLGRIRLASGTLLFLIVAVPWHVLVARANPEFVSFYFVHEHLLRYFTKVHERYEPAWYFVPVVLGGIIPWTAFVAQSLAAVWPRSWARRQEDRTGLFLLLWPVLVVGFFSLSDSKLIPYVLPAIPPLALVIGRHLERLWERPERREPWNHRELRIACSVMLGLGVVLAAAVVLAPVWAGGRPKVERALHLLAGRQYLLAGGLLLLAIVPFVFARLRQPDRALASLVVASLLVLASLDPCARAFDLERSTKALALDLKVRLRPGDRVVCYRNYFQDLPVYLGRTVIVAGWKGELEMGTTVEDTTAWIMDLGAFERLWRSPETVYMVADDTRFPKLKASQIPFRVLGWYGRKALMVNR